MAILSLAKLKVNVKVQFVLKELTENLKVGS